MSSIEFVSHEAFPEDQYVKEMVYLLIDQKYRVAYVRKQAKNGGQFWSVPTLGVTKEGVKTYYETFMQDSSFLEKDIKLFLDQRSWQPNRSAILAEVHEANTKTIESEDCPF